MTVKFANAYLGEIPQNGNPNQPATITLIEQLNAEAGSGVYFVQADDDQDGLFDAAVGSNMPGTLHVDGVAYQGTISRLHKTSGNVVEAFYFLQSAQDAGTEPQKAFLLDLQDGVEFELGATCSLSSDNVLSSLNAELNHPPIDEDESVSMDEDSLLEGNVLDNASDPDVDSLSVLSFSVGGASYSAGELVELSQGTLTINSDGSYAFAPAPDYSGPVPVVTYTVSDGYGETVESTLTLTVNAVDDIVDDAFSLNEDGSLTYNVISNSDGGADSFEGTPVITSVTNGSNGTVSIGTGGNLTYTPDTDFNGTDSFTYTVTSGGVTETATVNVTVNPLNDPGSFGGDTSGTGDEDGGAITGTLTFSDTADGDSNPNFTIASGNGPANGTASIDATTGAWSYTPNADWNGSDSFTFTVADDDGNTETQVISLTVNAVDDIVDDAFSLNEDGSLTYNVISNSDGGADSFEGTPVITSVTNGSNGTVSIGTGGNLTYTPDTDFNGTDSFTYTVTSGGVTETATVNVTVEAVPDPSSIQFGESITLNEEYLPDGTAPGSDVLTKESTFILEAPDGVSALYLWDKLVIDQSGQIVDGGPFVGDAGQLTIVSYDQSSGVVTYSYTLEGTLDHGMPGQDLRSLLKNPAVPAKMGQLPS